MENINLTVKNLFITLLACGNISKYFKEKNVFLFKQNVVHQWVALTIREVHDLTGFHNNTDYNRLRLGLKKGTWCVPLKMTGVHFKLYGLTYAFKKDPDFENKLLLSRVITAEETVAFNNRPTNELQLYLKNIFGEFGCLLQPQLINGEVENTKIPYVANEAHRLLDNVGIRYYRYNNHFVTVCCSKTIHLGYSFLPYPDYALNIAGSFSIPASLVQRRKNQFQTSVPIFWINAKGKQLWNILDHEEVYCATLYAHHNVTILILPTGIYHDTTTIDVY